MNNPLEKSSPLFLPTLFVLLTSYNAAAKSIEAPPAPKIDYVPASQAFPITPYLPYAKLGHFWSQGEWKAEMGADLNRYCRDNFGDGWVTAIHPKNRVFDWVCRERDANAQGQIGMSKVNWTEVEQACQQQYGTNDMLYKTMQERNSWVCLVNKADAKSSGTPITPNKPYSPPPSYQPPRVPVQPPQPSTDANLHSHPDAPACAGNVTHRHPGNVKDHTHVYGCATR